MKERGSVLAGLTIFALIGIVAATITIIPLNSTADKVDNKTKLNAQTAADDFVNEVCSKGSADEEDFNKLIQKATSGLGDFKVEIEIHVQGEDAGKKTQIKRDNGKVYTAYYTSQVEDVWKSNDGKFPMSENDQVKVSVLSSSNALDQDSVTDKVIAEATGTCTTNGKN